MNKIYSLLTVVFCLVGFAQHTHAQAPEKMSYQAVVRDASNMLVANQTVGIQISILQGSATGTAVYEETHAPLSNDNGLVSLEIGSGTVLSGVFSTIDWSNGPFFIQTETDPTGGTNYTISGTSQLMSVPYALHATTATSLEGGINYTETDPVFGASVAGGITAADTANWNNHIVDTDTQLSESQVDAFTANNGYITAEVDGSITNEIQDLQLSSNMLTITNNGTATNIDLSPYLDNTDTQIDSTGIAALGFVAGPHTSTLKYLGMARAKNLGSPNPNVDNEIPNTTWTVIRWLGLIENYGNSIGGTNNTTITIPAGVDFIRINTVLVYDQILTTSDSKSTFSTYKNGNPFIGLTNAGFMTHQRFNSFYGFNYHSTFIPVVAGDVFDIRLFQDSGTSLYLNWGSISSVIAFEFYAQ